MGKWADFDTLVDDLSTWLEHEKSYIKSRLLVRTIAFLFYQRNVIEELRGERATLEARVRETGH
jgi:hypothetical protein